ncbi:ABC-2 family transporter protein [Poriferisphaera corsica]|uniref:ABC-2 family transporter protein n=1 Tax=Poriferisphaera corsica TaxID=2528020 RepID=A0A517YTU2_9BACT|nr:ABC transporter permease [Poriferisphaera corsica]QDU33638.1 ABC-2 family transporter protein [Poriferisphaera corsica]
MTKILTLAKRELEALFFSPVAYLALAIFAFITAFLFTFGIFQPGFPATMAEMYTNIVWLLIFIAPAISMRLISEEASSGTLEMLMTSPISDTQIILGKWLGALAFYVVLLSPIFLQIILLEVKADPDYGPILTGLLGMLFVGGLYLAIGIFVSAFNNSQLVSFMITVLITGLFTFGMYFLARADFLPASIKMAMFTMNVNEQFSNFSKGLIDIRNIIYFLSAIAFFLFLGIKTLETRRWS